MKSSLIHDLITILYSVGSINSLFIALIVITIEGANTRSNRYFSILLLVISLSCFYVLFLPDEIVTAVPYLFGGMQKSAFIYGPTLYFYFMSITRRRFHFTIRELVHFLPFVVYTVMMMPVYLKTGAQKISFYESSGKWSTYLFFIIFLHFSAYMLYTWFFITKNGVIILKKFKGVEGVATDWFRYVSLLSLGAGCFCLVMLLFQLFLGFNVFILNVSTDLIIIMLIHFLGFQGIRRIEILQYVTDKESTMKYQKSGMNKLQAENYMDAIVQYIEREKNFTDSGLNLKSLSSALKISEHHLSQVFSQYLKITFSDYINSLRIDEAKKLIRELPADYPVVRIAFDVGFNSKSSFNQNFKKFTGMTPSGFKTGIDKK